MQVKIRDTEENFKKIKKDNNNLKRTVKEKEIEQEAEPLDIQEIEENPPETFDIFSILESQVKKLPNKTNLKSLFRILNARFEEKSVKFENLQNLYKNLLDEKSQFKSKISSVKEELASKISLIRSFEHQNRQMTLKINKLNQEAKENNIGGKKNPQIRKNLKRKSNAVKKIKKEKKGKSRILGSNN